MLGLDFHVFGSICLFIRTFFLLLRLVTVGINIVIADLILLLLFFLLGRFVILPGAHLGVAALFSLLVSLLVRLLRLLLLVISAPELVVDSSWIQRIDLANFLLDIVLLSVLLILVTVLFVVLVFRNVFRTSAKIVGHVDCSIVFLILLLGLFVVLILIILILKPFDLLFAFDFIADVLVPFARSHTRSLAGLPLAA